jgi:hypothetical protein
MGRARRREGGKAVFMTTTRSGSEGCEPFVVTTAEMKPRTQALEARKDEEFISKQVARGHRAFATESDKAKRGGPKGLSNDALLRACRNAHKPWIKCGKYFREAYKRAKQGRIPGVRTQAELCRSIGCSLRWLQLVLDGSAADSNKQKANSTNHQRGAVPREPKDDEDYADEITRYPERELETLMDQDPEQFRELCTALASALIDAAKRIQPSVQRAQTKERV